VKSVSACGVAIVSPTPDITNARIEFENGSVANLTASRISLKNMRKTRIFQNDAYITVDFLDKKTEITRIHDHEVTGYPYSMTLDLANGQTRQITLEKPEIHPINAIQTELESFYDSIIHNTTPVVSIHDGVKVLNLAHIILREAEYRIQKAEERSQYFASC
jgi:predicted dehydrogenase